MQMQASKQASLRLEEERGRAPERKGNKKGKGVEGKKSEATERKRKERKTTVMGLCVCVCVLSDGREN